MTSVGTLIADIWAYASRTLTSGAAPTVGEIDTELTAEHGAGAWTTGGAGSGANTVTLTFTDTNAAALSSAKVSIKGTGITTTTTSLGVATFSLDDDSYTVVTYDTATHIGEENALVVSGDTADAYVVTARSIPVPDSVDQWVLWAYCTDEQGEAVGAAERTLRVIAIMPTHDAGNNLIAATEKKAVESDASGIISFNCPKSVTWMEVEIAKTMADGTTDEERYSFEIDAGAADASDRIPIPDLLPD